jgi:hypothetical protein
MPKKVHLLEKLGMKSSFFRCFLINEFSPEMLKEIGCTWIILGHSERGTLFHEDDDVKKNEIFDFLI